MDYLFDAQNEKLFKFFRSVWMFLGRSENLQNLHISLVNSPSNSGATSETPKLFDQDHTRQTNIFYKTLEQNFFDDLLLILGVEQIIPAFPRFPD